MLGLIPVPQGEISYIGPVCNSRSQVVRWVTTATGLALLVALPALFARPFADDRVYLYWSEEIAGNNPALLLVRVFEEIPGYLELGVFRWLSRLWIFLENWVLLRVSMAIGVPLNIARVVPKVLMVAAVASVLKLTFDQYRLAGPSQSGQPTWRHLWGVLALTFAASLTMFQPATHPLVLFPSLYLGTAALALGVPLLLGRLRLDRDRSLGAKLAVGWPLVGAALASMIELAYLAIPLSLLHLYLLDRSGSRQLLRSRAGRAWLFLTGGFLAVFVPVRIIIARICADGSCYQAADPGFGPALLEAWPQRLLSGAFPVLQMSQFQESLTSDLDMLVWAFAGGALAGWILTRYWSYRDPMVPPPRLGSVAIYLAGVLLGASLLASLSQAVQIGEMGLAPWRETGFAWFAWSGLIAIGFTYLLRLQPLWTKPVVGAVLVGSVFIATLQNGVDLAATRAQPESRLHNQIALLLVNFDRTDAGNADRCAVFDELTADPQAERNRTPFLVNLVDAVAANHYGRSFCERGD